MGREEMIPHIKSLSAAWLSLVGPTALRLILTDDLPLSRNFLAREAKLGESFDS
jgi:hypothetical protein